MDLPFKKNRKKLKKDDWATLITLSALVFGSFLRFYQAVYYKYPVNDGGMFYTMINDLRRNGYSLPLFTTYNGSNIPFAYPPLPFYLAAGVADIFRLPVMDVLRFLPALFSVLALFAYNLLARTVLEDDKLTASLATTAYAFMPSGFFWLIMGGGLTRSLGQLFLLLSSREVYLLFTKPKRSHVLLATLTVSLLALSHPEAILNVLGFCAVIWLIRARNKISFLDGIKVGIGAIIVTSIWWLPNLLRHGWQPFLSAVSTGNSGTILSLKLLSLDVSQEPFLTILAVLGFIGIWATLAERNYLYIGWLVIPFLIDPRSESTTAAIPLSLLAAIALTKILVPSIFAIENRHRLMDQQTPFTGLIGRLFLIFFFGYIFFANFIFLMQITPNRLDVENVQAMKWVNENTTVGSRFIVLTGQSLWACDSINEWFPALAERTSLTTLQGQEWILGRNFNERMANIISLQECANEKIECVEQEALALKIPYDYIYITKTIPYSACLGSHQGMPSIWSALTVSPNYLKVYDGEGAGVFRLLGK